MPIFSLGALNTTALTAPDTYIQKVSPKTKLINGVPSDILGVVGIASWGAVNSPVASAQSDTFGPVTNRSRDLSTAIMVSNTNGAQNITAVRVTDGTDTAATVAVLDAATPTPATGMTLTAFYTGTVGNTLNAAITAGTANNSYKLTIQRPGYVAEVFDNITGSGNALWAALVSAVNSGISGVRGPSQLAVATVGASTALPNTTSAYTLAGGTDGASSVTDTTLIGTDGVTPSARKGMYALRGSGAQVMNLADHSASADWPSIVSFANSEGLYAPTAGTAGASYSTTATALNTAGADDPSLKVLVGDWVYWWDSVNSVMRLLSPATFVAAEIAATAPHQSSLNKKLWGVNGTQRSSQQQPYSLSEIGNIATARLDVIANPCPGGAYFGCRTGRNASSDPTRNGDNYTRMTNYLAATFAKAYGWVIGQPQTTDLRNQVKVSLESFLTNMQGQGMIDSFSVTCDATNNPPNRVALGYLQANVQVRYLGIVWFFLVNLEGGQTVTVNQVGFKAAA